MRLIDFLMVRSDGEERRLELWQGDLTAMPRDMKADVLVVSAFPDDYAPLPGTLIGALDRKGVSVAALAEDKLVDLRHTHSCWLSRELHTRARGIRARQILCFEPFTRGAPEEVVGDIFRALAPFACQEPPIADVVMPLISTGDAGVPPTIMLEALFDAAVAWLEHGLPIRHLRIVARTRLRAAEMAGAFAILKRHYQRRTAQPHTTPAYDVFVSYCQVDAAAADCVVAELRRQRPQTRIFMDRLELQPGMAWQTKIYQSLASARKVLALYSPAYLQSKACQEEYNIARVLHRQTRHRLLFPVYLYSAPLPPYMAEWQYLDCREAAPHRLADACSRLLAELERMPT